MKADRNGLDILERPECLELLGQCTLGRVAISVGALPTILPINFRLIDGHVVFRTGVGSKLDAATRGAVIAFEVDDFDAVDHTGWSVVVTGIAQESPASEWAGPIMSSAIPRWAPAGASRILFLPTDIVSGRRITRERAVPAPAPAPASATATAGARA
ncbi:pyridoxamine 5'-phosphate oxidase family protein [Iamia sp. SCSIO 61187]|uniref:pyridoxamine 5'-phosphate oxidase family protein n=1 Tax=Iamia sp. SCSIO 61187 TaxID=2722752 RepID=UPI001C6290B1|nr:pyridoxamine 5'-phosphate oxidase family protein [Iamia sp. SCSIO 61187]QYG93500.1 pyridoxamine 5'-phosphate oxidase family protein [Iamia sp. SCSIO 61187]